MNRARISQILRAKARKIMDEPVDRTGFADSDAEDTGELLNVLARVIEGKPVEESFGAPGDWGYGTPIGEALRQRGADA